MRIIFSKDGLNIKNRPEVTQRVIDGFTGLLDSQDDKGIEKYGTTIDEAVDDNYDWRLMAMEELADYSKYQVKEIRRLEKEVKYWQGLNLQADKTITGLREEIELLKAEKAHYMEMANGERWQKVAKARLNEMRELQWRNIDLQNEVAALKETDQNQVITQEAFEKVMKERDELKEKLKQTIKTHDCRKNQMIIWQDERCIIIDSIECRVCGKTLFEASNE